MKHYVHTLLASAGIAMLATVAGAATLTFDTTADCATGDVTITQGALESPCVLGAAPNGTSALLGTNGPSQSFWTARFSTSMSAVSVDLGDFGTDPDRLFLAVYDAFDTLLGAINIDISADDETMHGLTLSFGTDKIAWAAFGTQGGLGGIYADNLSFRQQTSTVPVPAAGGILALGLGGLAALRRRKSAA